jgi:predicted exporter
VIAGFDSPARYLPSARSQRARQASLPAPADLKSRFLAATAPLPLRQERFNGFLDEVEAARHLPPATRRRLDGTTLAAGVDALLVQRGAQWQALVPLEAMHTGPSAYMIDTGRVGAALGAVRVDGATVVVLDLKQESDALYSSYLGQSVRLSLAGLGAILVLLSIALRSFMRTLRVVVPLVLAVLVVISGFVVVRHAMTILNLVGLLLVVAIGSNYCLFFDREATHPGDAESARTLASLAVANASTVIGFGVLATSSVPVLSAVGLTVAPGTLLALLFGALLAGGAPAAEPVRHA